MASAVNEKMVAPMDVEKQHPISPEPIGDVPENILKHSHDADEAMKAFLGHEGEVIHLDEETNRKLLRKIDRNLMPVGEGPPSLAYDVYTDATLLDSCYV